MGESRLTPAQVEILSVLAGIEPAWRLSGGAALAGFHTLHRGTRALDLFWSGADLGNIDVEVRRRLEASGFRVEPIQRDVAFRRFRLERGSAIVVLDLVADPLRLVEKPTEHRLGNLRILVDEPHEILVSKLCALLGRSELRDLEDVEALLRAGCDLARAVGDAPTKDAGFSPVTLAWVVEQLPVSAMGKALGRGDADVRRLEAFRDEMAKRVLELARPE